LQQWGLQDSKETHEPSTRQNQAAAAPSTRSTLPLGKNKHQKLFNLVDLHPPILHTATQRCQQLSNSSSSSSSNNKLQCILQESIFAEHLFSVTSIINRMKKDRLTYNGGANPQLQIYNNLVQCIAFIL
jgi:hypothetical protein